MAKSFPNTGVTAGLATDRTSMTGMVAGTPFYETDTKKYYVYNGASWIQENDYTTTAMIVDSSGRVRLPNQPAFSVQKNNGNVGGNSVIVWNSVLYNTGGGYNASNGYFTAPIAGTYMFSIYGMGEWGLQYWRIDIYVNGTLYKQAYSGWYGTTGYNHTSITFPVPMAAGDYIYVVSGSVTMYGTYQYNGFTGYLVG